MRQIKVVPTTDVVNKWNEEYSRKFDEARLSRITLCEALEKAKLTGLL